MNVAAEKSLSMQAGASSAGLDVRNVTVTYRNGQAALVDAGFSIPRGTITALVGVNGSGKSTLFKAIMGFVPLAAGSVSIMGEPAGRALRRNVVAYVPQAEEVDWNFPILGEDGVMMAADVAAMGDKEEDWTRVNMLLDTVETHELLGPHVSPRELLVRLFHEETPRVWEPQPVGFGCTCSAEKVVTALRQYSARDIGHMTTEDGKVTADCQFCGAHYEFAPETLGFDAERPAEGDGVNAGDPSA